MSVESNVTFRMGTKMQCDAALEYLRKELGLLSAFPNYSDFKVDAMNCFSVDNFEPHITECARYVAKKYPHLNFYGSGCLVNGVDGSTINIDIDYRYGKVTISVSDGDMYLDPTFPECPECENELGNAFNEHKFTCPYCGTSFQHVDYDCDDDDDDEFADFTFSTEQRVAGYVIKEDSDD